MKDIVTASAQIEGVSTRKDGTIKITVGTQELPAEDGAVLLGLNQRQGYFAFSERPVQAEDLVGLPDLIIDNKKAKSATSELRAALYVLGKKLNKADVDGYVEQWIIRAKEQVLEKIREIDD